MLTKEIFQNDPQSTSLANNGVAKVEDDQSSQALDTLSFEIKTFVCDGKYQEGLDHILRTYIDQLKANSEQKGVWISGFFGSGKSHLAKMLRTFWVNQALPNGLNARALADLPDSTNALLDELAVLGQSYNGLHGASGTLGSGSKDKVRLSLLRIIFKSAGLPEQYHLARFVLWLKSQGCLEQVKAEIGEEKWQKEVRNIHVSPILHKALLKALPDVTEPKEVREMLRAQFQEVKDITNEQMVDSIFDALEVNGELPLTLVVMDEVQQYIGLDEQRSYDVQEVVETCCGASKLKSKLLFVATGQSALSGLPNLMKLMGRFQVTVQLEDTDVDAVIRKVILQKKETARPSIDAIVQKQLGEISRHLQGSKIEHTKDDEAFIVADYPLLPVRRRFWENVLHALDKTGTGSQLRNQLKIVHEACRETAEKELGHIVPADFIYDQIAINAQQNQMISKDIYETIGSLQKAGKAGDETKTLQARIIALILLMSKLPPSNEVDHGIVPTADNIASLMKDDLNGDTHAFRKQIPELLEQLEKDGLLMSLQTSMGTEYRLQTTESVLWYDKYNQFKHELEANRQKLDTFRQQLIQQHVRQQISQVRLSQGESMVTRHINASFDTELPRDADEKIYAWVLNSTEKAFIDEARGAKQGEPTIFVYVPNTDRTALQQAITEQKAAEDTIANRSTTQTEAGRDARSAMQHRLGEATKQIDNILKEMFSNIQVKQAGGADVEGDTLTEQVQRAGETSMVLLYPDFKTADQKDWSKVYERARKEGGETALEVLGWKQETGSHPVCEAIKRFIAVSKTGIEIKDNFLGNKYGWSQDAIDGALYAMLAAGVLTATDTKGAAVAAKTLERKQLNQCTFRPENVTISKVQLIKVRGLINALGVSCTAGEEPNKLGQAIQNAKDTAHSCGGDAPLPASPATPVLDTLQEITGNAQLQQAFENKAEIESDFERWQKQEALVATRKQQWVELKDVLVHCRGLVIETEIHTQMQAISDNRSLLAEPSPVEPLIKQAITTIRDSIVSRHGNYESEFQRCMDELAADKQWQQLNQEQQQKILAQHDIAALPELNLAGNEAVLRSLENCSLSQWNDRQAALVSRFDAARFSAVEATQPKVQRHRIAKPTLETEQELDEWLAKLKQEILVKLAEGPVAVN